jgi:hypothetical protein
MLFLVLSSPALRVAPPVMQLRGGVPFAPQQQAAPVSTAPGGTAGFTGGVVPTPAAQATLQQKVETLRSQLNLASGQTLAETIAKGVQTIGLEADVKSLNMLQTVDACLQTIGAAPATEPAVAAPQEGQEQGQGLVRVRRGPPPLGYGDSYEGAMFGDYGYGGFGGYSPYGYSYGYGRGGTGWGGYGRDSAWDVAYGGGDSLGRYGGRYGLSGLHGGYGMGYGYGSVGYGYGSSRGYGSMNGRGMAMYSGYSTGGYGGYGSWGPNAGRGGLRLGSAAERAIARSDVVAASDFGRMTGDGRM